ncbi:Adenosylmethionine-8-amino-7-oxononanoate aminotransferase [Candidatus Cyrtobacter comes]|uniref:Adenosylmethionine-8-amino-7-oxononanoate aminotransferase n=1 Tax=Candidatus Cyrtobacter comes TaxID=675776 RepID=A0ABU5L949_9RICK|nr:adenosylmethionine--8-amino-7-oxononanoate transaminase [Candidatus Cyrtobacter comes]MDZ5762644.1 Adenosylmethionine-8-amino-7-oxononanoate aminotransferase [Candidatus Cyrtobacter comes]
MNKNLIWHPFTQQKNSVPELKIIRGDGAYLFDADGNKYIDLISSWWVNLHGHAHPEIARAIYNQALKLEHVIFAGFTHEPAIRLCEELSSLIPDRLTKFFFSDNGSTSVEVALKMAYQFWYNQGDREKTLFLSFDGSYHGDTLGAMSVSNSGFHDHFKKLQFQSIKIKFPHTWIGDTEIEEKEEVVLRELVEVLDEYSNKISALILEPLVQGAGGMRMCRVSFLNRVLSAIKERGIFIIFDEVMTGFYRTGTLFALDQILIKPDFLCISKGITGGFLPLALTITTDIIYNAFLGDDFFRAFAHGHSYTANPIACAAAIKSIEILKNSICNIININSAHLQGLDILKQSERISGLRVCGTIAAFEVHLLHANLNAELKKRFLSKGMLLRPLGNTVYLLPPYCITQEEILNSYRDILEVVNGIQNE